MTEIRRTEVREGVAVLAAPDVVGDRAAVTSWLVGVRDAAGLPDAEAVRVFEMTERQLLRNGRHAAGSATPRFSSTTTSPRSGRP